MTSTPRNKRTAWLQGPSARCQDIGESQNPWRLVLLGAPGVGKGTQAELLHQRLKACHLSTGDVFRTAGKAQECAQTAAMKEALGYMRRGELVPDSTVWEMVRERSECLRCQGGFILDGFPRTLGQAELLTGLMQEEGLTLSAVINYALPTSEIVARISGRRTCDKCKLVYHIKERPPQVEGCCDRCGGTLFQREDDRPESIKVRLEAYDRSTAPLISFYEKTGLLIQISAIGTPTEIFEKTLKKLEARTPEPASSSSTSCVANSCKVR